MNRTKFYEKVTVDGIDQLDFINNNLSRFTSKRSPGYHRVAAIDEQRPDLISFRNFESPVYWWMICLNNNIDHPLFHIDMNDVLNIPNLLLLFDFFKDYKMR